MKKNNPENPAFVSQHSSREQEREWKRGREDIHAHLVMLCDKIGERPTGSENCSRTEAYIQNKLETYGYTAIRQEFGIQRWTPRAASCICEGVEYHIAANPYSPSCDCIAPLVSAAHLRDLKTEDMKDKILIIHGELTKEPLMPRNFPYYTHEEHREIVQIIEDGEPFAVIAVADRTDYPVHIINDGDFPIPSCTVTKTVGELLIAKENRPASLRLDTETEDTTAANVIGQTDGTAGKKIVVCAHLDTIFGTGGALDNASGVATLLALAKIFSEKKPETPLEFVFFNGEECYCSPGEQQYFRSGSCSPETTTCAINIDGVGLKDRKISIAQFGCPDSILSAEQRIRKNFPVIEEVEPWPAGDHMVFFMNAIPSLAFTSLAEPEQLSAVLHTPSDTREVLDEGLILLLVDYLEEFIRERIVQ